MKRRLAIPTLLIAGAVLLFSGWRGRSRQQPDLVIRSDVRLVLLDVAVKDRAGRLVPNLKKDNFTVLENGKPQQITVFAAGDVPVTLGILVDESRSMAPKRNDVLTAAGDLIRTSNPRDEFFVLNFNDDVRRGLPHGVLFSDNIDQLRAALDRGVPRGRTALNDAVVDGINQLALGTREKKALVLISDGGDNASKHTRAEMFDLVERSQVTIYTIALADPTDPDWNPGILKHLANLSGGEAFFLNDLSGLAETCQGIAKEIRTRYAIGYAPSPGKNGALRHIHVRVAVEGRPGLVARTRTVYRYEDEPHAASK